MTNLSSSLAAMVADRNTWQGRANTSWGASRVWNSGSSFETDLGTMTTDRNTWQARANSAWGASRVWNSGSSFEADLANMTADRNNWQSSSNTWQSRANSAWGTSRVWSSGESWEAAYTRVLPPSSVLAAASFTNHWGANPGGDNMHDLQVHTWAAGSGGYHSVAANGSTNITCTHTGMYTVTVTSRNTYGTDDQQWSMDFMVNGTVIASSFSDSKFNGCARYIVWSGQLTNGYVLTTRARLTGGSSQFEDTRLYVYFIPTSTYPN